MTESFMPVTILTSKALCEPLGRPVEPDVLGTPVYDVPRGLLSVCGADVRRCKDGRDVHASAVCHPNGAGQTGGPSPVDADVVGRCGGHRARQASPELPTKQIGPDLIEGDCPIQRAGDRGRDDGHRASDIPREPVDHAERLLARPFVGDRLRRDRPGRGVGRDDVGWQQTPVRECCGDRLGGAGKQLSGKVSDIFTVDPRGCGQQPRTERGRDGFWADSGGELAGVSNGMHRGS